MQGLHIQRSFHPPEESLQGLAWIRGGIWVASAKAGMLFEETAVDEGTYATSRSLASPAKNPGGIAWDGQEFLVADRVAKVVFRVNPESGAAVQVLDLSELQFGDMPAVFRATNSQVSDIAWGLGHLWATCLAGYSSSLYRIDTDTGMVVQHLWASGPKPTGVSLDVKEEHVWTVDGSNQEFCQFTSGGEWTGTKLESPVARPRGLALDAEDAFWTSDEQTGQVYQIKRGV
jgi:sugar lactone lactonase YvrE